MRHFATLIALLSLTSLSVIRGLDDTRPVVALVGIQDERPTFRVEGQRDFVEQVWFQPLGEDLSRWDWLDPLDAKDQKPKDAGVGKFTLQLGKNLGFREVGYISHLSSSSQLLKKPIMSSWSICQRIQHLRILV